MGPRPHKAMLNGAVAYTSPWFGAHKKHAPICDSSSFSFGCLYSNTLKCCDLCASHLIMTEILGKELRPCWAPLKRLSRLGLYHHGQISASVGRRHRLDIKC